MQEHLRNDISSRTPFSIVVLLLRLPIRSKSAVFMGLFRRHSALCGTAVDLFQTLFQTSRSGVVQGSGGACAKALLWILQYEGKRTDYWYCRVATGNRKYAHRSLKTTDKATASERAYAAFAEILTQVKATGSASPRTIVNLCERWIKRQQDRNDGGTLSTTLTRAHQHLFSVYVPSYAEYKGWRLIKDIPHDGWVGYRKWRMEEGWKLIGTDKTTGSYAVALTNEKTTKRQHHQ